MKLIIKILLVIIFIFSYQQLICQNNGCDSCNCEADRILSTFEKYKSKYISVLKDSIRVSLKRDSIYEKNKLKEGDIDLDKFTYIINPILKLNKKAEIYYSYISFCKFFDVDTVTFGCEAGVFLNDSLYFYCKMGDFECNDKPFYLTIVHCHYFTNEIFFKKRFYPNIKLKFILKGYPLDYFLLNNKKIIIRDYVYQDEEYWDKRTAEILQTWFKMKSTRKVARDCHSE